MKSIPFDSCEKNNFSIQIRLILPSHFTHRESRWFDKIVIIFQSLVFVRTFLCGKSPKLCGLQHFVQSLFVSVFLKLWRCHFHGIYSHILQTIIRKMFEIFSLKEKTTCQNKSFSFYQWRQRWRWRKGREEEWVRCKQE